MAKAKRSQVIVDDYLRLIVSGELPEGKSLPTEPELEERYEVSRTAVREAVQTLAAKGFVQIKQGSGTTVAERVRWNVLDQQYLQITGEPGRALFTDLMETRDIFEPAIAGLAAQRADPAKIAELQALAAKQAALGHPNPSAHADIDIRFHHLLAECTGNPVLISLHASIVHLARAQRESMAADPGAVEHAAFWHKHIVDAVAQGDAAAARAAMRMHLRQVHNDLDSNVVSAEANGARV